MNRQSRYTEPTRPKRMFTGIALVMVGVVAIGLAWFTGLLS